MLDVSLVKKMNSFRSVSKDLPALDLKVEVDNRCLSRGSLFVAIVGEKYNPLDHLDIVLNSQCKFVLCEDKYVDEVKIYEKQLTFIFVSNITLAIGELGTMVAELFKRRGGVVVAISGSNGKTTTKEMLFHLLHRAIGADAVIATQKNNNNHLGVPFTLFQIQSSSRVAIVELGSNHPGEIKTLCEILQPQYGVTTNIGATHLEFFKTEEAVFEEESTLIQYADTFFINADDSSLCTLISPTLSLSYGECGKDFKFKIEPPYFFVNDIELKNEHITGEYNFHNLALAFSLACTISPENQRIFQELASQFVPTANRSEWIYRNQCQVFLDAYNANPSSMRLSIEAFLSRADKTCVLVLGDMNELGDNAVRHHEQLGHYLNQFQIGCVYFVGAFANDYAKAYQGDCKKYSSADELVRSVGGNLFETQFLFIKGSRSLQLESILDI